MDEDKNVVGSAPVATEPVASPAPVSNKKNLRKIGMIVGAAVLLVGASAAAYVGVYLPNKPENVFKLSLKDAVKADKVSYDGVANFKMKDESSPIKEFDVNLTAAVDTTTSSFQVGAEANILGVKPGIDVRKVGKNAYVKLNNLDQVATLAEVESPELGALVKQVDTILEDKAIEIDESLVKSMAEGAECLLDFPKVMAEADKDKLVDAYLADEFVTIKSHVSETLNGRSTNKYEVSIDGKKLDAWGQKVGDTKAFQEFEKCAKGVFGEEALKSTEESATTIPADAKIFVWADKKAKKFVKMEVRGSDADAGDFTVTLNIKSGEAKIEKPADSKPAVQVVGELQNLLTPYLGLLLGGFGGGTGGSLVEQCSLLMADPSITDPSQLPEECQALLGL